MLVLKWLININTLNLKDLGVFNTYLSEMFSIHIIDYKINMYNVKNKIETSKNITKSYVHFYTNIKYTWNSYKEYQINIYLGTSNNFICAP